MTGEITTTGPMILGRWSQPAALINAGRVTPDPYPLEQILYCATCHEQFFGTHQAGTRVYRTSCDCRPGPLPANEVELRVYAETHIHAFGPITDTVPNTVAGLTSAHYAVLAVRLFSRAEVGSTADEITFTARI
jgi:hypothetical protein